MPPFDPTPGVIIAERFLIEAPAGSGGMGAVFRARDLRSDQLVALKLLYKRAPQPQEYVRFTREAQLLADLHDPGIVAYIDHGQTADGIPYLTMEWLEGHDLSERLARRQLSLRESLLLLQKATSALSVAHAKGIIHRDRSDKHKICLRTGDNALHRRRTDDACLPLTHRSP